MIYGCIGEHLPHSFSKEIHNRIGDYDYCLTEIPMGQLDAFMEKKDFTAINVTIPYKQDVIKHLSQISDKAKSIGAVNTIVNKSGNLYGYNTDFSGLCDLIDNMGLSLKDKKVLILGTGGTSKTANAVAKSLLAKEVITVSRNKCEKFIDYNEAISKHTDAEIIINTTPAGMYPNIENSPIDLAPFTNLAGCVDAVYNPLRTNFVMDAMARGIKAQGGLYMLVAQAVRAYEFFFDTVASKDLTEKIYKDLFAEKENIVLTGMPGCGKSTVGNILKEKLGREFIDLDAVIVKNAGMPIKDIFEKYGEKYFRDLETEAVKEVARRSNVIIATGGGAVLREENVRLLKMNGRLYFIDRSIENLIPTDDRPLSSSVEAIKKRYNERIDTYIATADERVSMDLSPIEIAVEIERRHTK